jgi:hypothetical protein
MDTHRVERISRDVIAQYELSFKLVAVHAEESHSHRCRAHGCTTGDPCGGEPGGQVRLPWVGWGGCGGYRWVTE